MRIMTSVSIAVGFCLVFPGCASTKVIRNPGPKDHGIRYYRPKPYLLLKPGATAGTVDVSLTYLPDYNEEYSIQIRAGVGTNKTSVKLDNGWNLTGLDVDVDSKAAEMIGAVAGAAEKVAGFADQSEKRLATVEATDVPLGLYEAVLGCDDTGGKRLYGWRYVGFMPYAQCPIEGAGGPSEYSCDCPIWGLVWNGNKLTFRTIGQIANTKATETPSGVAPVVTPRP